MDDHVAKLMWALWTPTFHGGKISPEEVERSRELARDIHANRLLGIYVSVDDASDSVDPNSAIGLDQAEKLIALVKARLEIEAATEFREDGAHDELIRWFLDAAAERERARLVFGSASIKKLNELKGDARQWITWLKDQFDSADAEAKVAMSRELARAEPLGADAEQLKWKIQIKIVTTSHSIRPGVLKRWNEQTDWIQLRHIDNDKFALLVELNLRASVPVQGLWQMGWGISRIFVTALNIGTFGFFWWYKPVQTSRFYEKIIDLQQENFEIKVQRSPALEVKHPNKALKEEDLARAARCFSFLTKLGNELGNELVGPYIHGLTLLSKTDVHLDFVADACFDFATSLWKCLSHFSLWDGSEEARQQAFHEAFQDAIRKEEDRIELCELAMMVVAGARDLPSKVTLEEAYKLKLLCDVFLLGRSREDPNETSEETA